MEGLVGFAQEFLRDAPARARALEIDQKRESRLPGLKRAFEAFSREKIRFEDLASDISRALRETLSIG